MVGSGRLSRLAVFAKEHKQQLLCSISYYFAFIGLGISVTGFGPTLLELIDLTHSDETHWGYIFTVKGFGYFLGSTTGRLYDRFDGHRLLFIGISVSCGLFIAVPFITTVWGQGLIWCAIGTFTGMVDTGANTLIVWVWKEKVPPFMQTLHLAFGIGAVLSPLVLAALHKHSLFIQYLALGIPFGAAAIPVLFNKSPKNVPVVKEVEMRDKLVSSTDNVVMDSSFSVDGEGDDQISSMELDSSNISEGSGGSVDTQPKNDAAKARRLRIEVVFFAAILLLLDVGAEIGYGGWLPAYAQKQLNFDKKTADYVAGVFWGTFTFGRLVAVGASLVLTSKTMLLIDVAGCSLSLVILLLFSKSAVALWMCSLGFGFFIASVFPTVISLPNSLGVEVTGTDTSWMVVGASFGEMVVPMLIGILQKKYTLTILIVLVLAVEILGGIVFGILLIRVKYLKGELSGLNIFSRQQRGGNFTKLSDDSTTTNGKILIT